MYELIQANNNHNWLEGWQYLFAFNNAKRRFTKRREVVTDSKGFFSSFIASEYTDLRIEFTLLEE